MNNKHTRSFGIIIGLGLIVIVVAVIAGLLSKKTSQPLPDQAASQQIVAPSGNLIIDNLVQNQTVSLPMTVTGTVKGWFFEGSFPVFLKDNNGNQLAVGLASSSVDWMTANPIPFTVTLPTVSYTGPGTITFKKDNPSGEAQFDEEVVVNVVF